MEVWIVGVFGKQEIDELCGCETAAYDEDIDGFDWRGVEFGLDMCWERCTVGLEHMGYASFLVSCKWEVQEPWNLRLRRWSCRNDDLSALINCGVSFEREEAMIEILGLCIIRDIQNFCLTDQVPELVSVDDTITMIEEEF